MSVAGWWSRPSVGRVTRGCALVLGAVFFDLAYTQTPPYESNYSTYMLHGAARAGRGVLREDWLAKTTDPHPVVSAIVFVVELLRQPWLYCVLHVVLFAVYLAAITVIARQAFRLTTRLQVASFVGGAIVLHSMFLRTWSGEQWDHPWATFLHDGIAGQYLLGHLFQPSLFGVLEIASLAAFLRRRDRIAAVLAAAASCAHASYLITSTLLIATYAVYRVVEARGLGWRAFGRGLAVLGPAALVLVPYVVITMLRFAPTSAPATEEAARILVVERIPHHALWTTWDLEVLTIQALVVLIGLQIAARHRALWWPLTILTLAGIGLTLLTIESESHRLALLFPWRVSTVVVPMSSTLIVAWVLARLPPRPLRALVAAGALAAACYVAYRGYEVTKEQFEAHDRDPSNVTYAWVAQHPDPSALYLIPVGLERFRIETGARTYVDWKSHPYRDVEVLEWRRRLRLADPIQHLRGEELCRRVDRIASRDGVTHVVLPAGSRPRCHLWRTVHRGPRWAIYRLPTDAELAARPPPGQ